MLDTAFWQAPLSDPELLMNSPTTTKTVFPLLFVSHLSNTGHINDI